MCVLDKPGRLISTGFFIAQQYRSTIKFYKKFLEGKLQIREPPYKNTPTSFWEKSSPRQSYN